MQQVRDLLFPEVDTETAEAYLETGVYEPEVRAFVLGVCRRRRRAVEVGAHVGQHTVWLGRAFVQTEAFEAQEQVHRALERNVRRLPVRAHRLALGREAGTGYVNVRAGRNSAVNNVEGERHPATDPVPVRTLDEYGFEDVDLLKISIGRHPDDVIAGAMKTIEACRPVLWLGDVESWRSSILQTALALGRLGYRLTASMGHTLVMSAEEAAAAQPARDAPPRLIDDIEAGAKLVWDLASAAEPGAEPTTGVRVGAAVLQAQAIPYRGDHGAGRVIAAAVPPGLETGARGPVSVQAAVLDRLRLRFARGAVRICIPPEALAIFRDLVVTVDQEDGERVILREDLRLAANIDDIPARLPLELLSTRPRRFGLHLVTAQGHSRSVSVDLACDPAELTAEMVTCYRNHGGGGNPVIEAMAKAIGARMSFAEDGAREGAAIVWGVLRGSKDVIDQVAARDGVFYYIDHAYFARGHLKSYRITRNGFEAGAVRRCPSDRIEKLGVKAQPWRRGGSYILVCPPTDYFIEAHGVSSWLDDTLAELKRHTDREIVVRRKPQPGEAVVPLAEALAGAHALVTHSSNVAVEAAVDGTPVFVSPTSAAAPVGRTDLSLIEAPAYPDRDAWLAHLAYSQFSFEEIKYGAAWRMLLDWERREFI